ncbi:MAG: preprotein translocase subunit SecG [Ruminococcaceae bacterium]|nr:preprotein translocase subunit SecG [Oscillospiraceae bacterium]
MVFFQIALLLVGVVLTVAVLMQHGKSYGLSGTITGGAETFFGKEKGGRIDKLLARATTILGIVFVVLSLVTFLVQPGSKSDGSYRGKYSSISFAENATQEVPGVEDAHNH